MRFFNLVALCLAGVMMTTAQANTTTIYKSIGKKGEVRYSQVRPTDTNSFETLVMRSDGRTNDAGKMSTLPEQPTPPSPNADALRAETAEKQLQEQRAQETARICQNLRANLAAYSTGGRIFETNAEGQKVYLNDQEISSKKQRTIDTINQHCQ